MVSGHLKSIGIPRVDGLSTGPPGSGASHILLYLAKYMYIMKIHWTENE